MYLIYAYVTWKSLEIELSVMLPYEPVLKSFLSWNNNFNDFLMLIKKNKQYRKYKVASKNHLEYPPQSHTVNIWVNILLQCSSRYSVQSLPTATHTHAHVHSHTHSFTYIVRVCKIRWLPVSVNIDLLEHSHAYLFTHCP